MPTGDEIDEDAQPGNDNDKNHPECLDPSTHVLASENISQDPEQAHKPRKEQEELEQGQQERAIVVEHAAPFRRPRRWMPSASGTSSCDHRPHPSPVQGE